MQSPGDSPDALESAAPRTRCDAEMPVRRVRALPRLRLGPCFLSLFLYSGGPTTGDDAVSLTQPLDWTRATEHLRDCREAYAGIGTAGMFALTVTIMPLTRRLELGERTPELHAEIMGVKL